MMFKNRKLSVIVTGIIMVLLITACTPVAATEEMDPTAAETMPIPETGSLTPSVRVSDQEIVDNRVVIDEVVSNGPGWLVVHADSDGSPGPVIGHAAVEDGVNEDLSVEVDTASATDTMYAMLHTDAGTVGTYEFPGEDGPVAVDGQVVTPSFSISMLAQDGTPMVAVADQEVKGGSVIIDRVVSDGPGWLVVHADSDGGPGPVIGYAPVEAGTNEGVIVEIDTSAATDTLFAMLHTDAGMVGTYEFPGDDGPVRVDGQVVTLGFVVTVAMDESKEKDESEEKDEYGDMYGSKDKEATVKVASDPELGDFLVDGEGMTLYLFTQDEPGVSNCSGPCLVSWPPLTVEGEPVAGEGVTGELSTITLEDGSSMVTYNDIPLYYYAPDQEPGDILGEGVGGVWYVVSP